MVIVITFSVPTLKHTLHFKRMFFERIISVTICDHFRKRQFPRVELYSLSKCLMFREQIEMEVNF